MTTTLLPRPDWLSRLRSIMVLRPGQRVAHVPGIGVRASRRAVSAGGAVDWWLGLMGTGALAVSKQSGFTIVTTVMITVGVMAPAVVLM